MLYPLFKTLPIFLLLLFKNTSILLSSKFYFLSFLYLSFPLFGKNRIIGSDIDVYTWTNDKLEVSPPGLYYLTDRVVQWLGAHTGYNILLSDVPRASFVRSVKC